MACLIAAPASGSGKTLVSLALTALLRRRGESIQPFKVGPDYLDPQLLSAVAGHPCRNLDPLLCGEDWVEHSFRGFGSRCRHALVEGVMGLYDGRGASSEGSSAAVAIQLGLPVVLVVEASRQAGSLAALVRGFRDHEPRLQLAGVVLNGVGSERHRALLQEALASIGMALLGALPRHDALSLPSRHLGLLPAHELADLNRRCEQWADLAERHLDLEQLLPLLDAPAPHPDGLDPIHWCLSRSSGAAPAPGRSGEASRRPAPLPVAMACDGAFHFRYPEATELLAAQGLEVEPWSPLADEPLPDGCRALILPGGYPELHAAQLDCSRRSLHHLRQAAAAGLPIYAECGGLLLLGQELEDLEGQGHAMAGVLPFRARRGELSLGYRRARVQRDGLVVRSGETWDGHEFHRWQLQTTVASGDGLWQLEGWGSPSRGEGWSTLTLHASWLHLHWAGCSAIPRRLRAAAEAHAPASGWRWTAENPEPTPTSSAGA